MASTMRAITFWRRTLREGAAELNSAGGWAGSIILFLGVVAGIAVPVVTTSRPCSSLLCSWACSSWSSPKATTACDVTPITSRLPDGNLEEALPNDLQ